MLTLSVHLLNICSVTCSLFWHEISPGWGQWTVTRRIWLNHSKCHCQGQKGQVWLIFTYFSILISSIISGIERSNQDHWVFIGLCIIDNVLLDSGVSDQEASCFPFGLRGRTVCWIYGYQSVSECRPPHSRDICTTRKSNEQSVSYEGQNVNKRPLGLIAQLLLTLLNNITYKWN